VAERARAGAKSILLKDAAKDAAIIVNDLLWRLYMPLDEIQFEAEESMEKALEHLRHELRGLRTGRATTALVEYIKVNYYGTPTDLRGLATITTPDASSIVIKPFDPGSLKDIVRGLEEANLGINPQSDGRQVRMVLPALSGERRKQLATKVKEASEQSRVAMRNVRRDANRKVEQEKKDSLLSEDEAKRGTDAIQTLLKSFETKIDEAVATKTKEIMDS
jgi:ribosome recycling factor